MEGTADFYFEKQSQVTSCLVHALNNLLGKKLFSPEDLKKISNEIAITKPRFFSSSPHHNPLTGGDFDANVLIAALSKNGYDYNWMTVEELNPMIEKCRFHGRNWTETDQTIPSNLSQLSGTLPSPSLQTPPAIQDRDSPEEAISSPPKRPPQESELQTEPKDEQKSVGLIINHISQRSSGFFGKLIGLSGRHWISVKILPKQKTYIIFDSLWENYVVYDASQLLKYFTTLKDPYFFLVTHPQPSS